MKAEWLSYGEDDLFRLHFTMGSYLRNHYRMWDRANPYARAFASDPDDRAMRILDMIWKRVRAGEGHA